MKHRLAAAATALTLLTGTAPALPVQTVLTAQAEEALSGTCGGHAVWTLENGTLTVSGTGDIVCRGWILEEEGPEGWNGHRGEIERVIIEDGITGIGSTAFAWCNSLTSVSLPDSVTYISSEAFVDCSSLTQISIPGSVRSIGWSAFGGCTALTSVTMGDSVESIDSIAFDGCTSLTDVTLSGNITSFGSNVFRDTPWLAARKEETAMLIVNGVLIDGSQCSGDVVIPDTVRIIADDAFMYSSMDTLTIPEGITSIGSMTFARCGYLKSVKLPESLTSIGPSAFEDDSALTEITIPGGVTEIEGYAFCRCSALEAVTIPASVQEIGTYAFMDTPWLEARREEDPFVIVNDILIDGRAVKGVAEIPEGVRMIGASAFGSNGGSNTDLTGVVIPPSVTVIGETAFGGCTGLTEVVIPETVTSMQEWTFLNCDALTDITILNPNCMLHRNSGAFGSNAVIHGNSASTARIYAEENGYAFRPIDDFVLFYGDCSLDGTVSVLDAVVLQKHLVNEAPLTVVQLHYADFNYDDKVNILDLAILKRLLLSQN
ncbi:MAG: leucine-rich repeat protein [Oscillospiraceae bacterium]|nr:leucine-rich repeat protein [Oscillospiraceae bacterium]